MRKFRVGAFDGDVFSHWASVSYKSFDSAFEYCSECIRKCSPKTGKKYRVIQVDE